MEREEFREKQDRTLGVRMKSFLMVGKKKEEKPKPVEGPQVNQNGPIERNVVECFENFTNLNLRIDSRTTPSQDEGTIFSDVTKEHPPISDRPIRRVIKFFEDLSTNQKTGIKRQLQGKLESPAKCARSVGSYGEGPSKYYMGDFQQQSKHECSEGEGVAEDTHEWSQSDKETYSGSSLRSSLSPSPGPLY